jgi:hypothetical protein
VARFTGDSMRVLNWPGPVVDKKRNSEYEWAYIKAYLEGESNERTHRIYTEMYGSEPIKGVPYWLVRLAIYYGALSIGYERNHKKMPPIEAMMLSCVSKLNETELRDNVNLMKHMRRHDFEDAAFGGREVTE